jgi:hypothetical protein
MVRGCMMGRIHLCLINSGAEEVADDLGLGAVVVHAVHEVGEPVAQVVHLLLQALYVVARLFQQLRRRRLCTIYHTHYIYIDARQI